MRVDLINVSCVAKTQGSSCEQFTFIAESEWVESLELRVAGDYAFSGSETPLLVQTSDSQIGQVHIELDESLVVTHFYLSIAY